MSMPSNSYSEHIKLLTTGVVVAAAITATIAIIFKAIQHVQVEKEVKKDSMEFSKKYESMLSNASKTHSENSKENIQTSRISTIDVDYTTINRTDNTTNNNMEESKSSAVDDTNTTEHTGIAEANIINKETSSKLATSSNHIRVIYGSESGNAESLAQGLVNTLHEHGLSATLINPVSWNYFDQYLYNNPHHSLLFKPIDDYVDTNCNDTCKVGSDISNSNTENNNVKSNVCSVKQADVSTTGKATIKEKWKQQREEKRRHLPIYIFVVSTTGVGDPPANYMTLYYEMERLSEKFVAQQVPNSSTHASHNVFNEVKQQSNSTNDSQSSKNSDNIKPTPPFVGIRYAIFGLGDSSYTNYNRCALMTRKFLQNGGGEEICRISFGDAVKGNEEEVFDHWKHNLIYALRDKCRFALTDKHSEMLPPRPEMRLRFFPSGKMASWAFPLPSSSAWPSAQKPIPLHLIAREQVSVPREDEHGSAVYHLTFDIHEARCVYQGGDHFGVYATNPKTVVQRCATLFELSDEVLSMPVELVRTVSQAIRSIQSSESSTPTSPSHSPSSSKATETNEIITAGAGVSMDDNGNRLAKPESYTVTTNQIHEDDGNVLPARVSLREVLCRYVDLCGKPKKAVLQTLCKYCTNQEEKFAFNHLITSPVHTTEQIASVEKTKTTRGSSSFSEELVDQLQFRTVLDYLEHFPSCRNISLGHFLEIMPRIQPRYYSIASDSLSEPDRIEIYVRETMDGLASPFLCHRLSVHSYSKNSNNSKESNVNYSECNSKDVSNKSKIDSSKAMDNKWNDESTKCVYAFVRQSQFHHPARLTTQPLIMIAAGTGVAGLIGVCHRRESLMRKLQLQNRKSTMMSSKQKDAENNNNNSVKGHSKELSLKISTSSNMQVGPCVLFFGIRSRDGEYFVKDKLERWALCHSSSSGDNLHSTDMMNNINLEKIVENSTVSECNELLPFPVITLLECAFSRDQNKKEYVTDLLSKHEDYIFDLLNDETHDKNSKCVLYISGDVTHMAKNVDQILVEIIQRKKSISRIEAINFLQKMESERRYLKDVY